MLLEEKVEVGESMMGGKKMTKPSWRYIRMHTWITKKSLFMRSVHPRFICAAAPCFYITYFSISADTSFHHLSASASIDIYILILEHSGFRIWLSQLDAVIRIYCHQMPLMRHYGREIMLGDCMSQAADETWTIAMSAGATGWLLVTSEDWWLSETLVTKLWDGLWYRICLQAVSHHCYLNIK